jgi:hypothetical protein
MFAVRTAEYKVYDFNIDFVLLRPNDQNDQINRSVDARVAVRLCTTVATLGRW